MTVDRTRCPRSWRWRDVFGLVLMVAVIVALHFIGAWFTIGPGGRG